MHDNMIIHIAHSSTYIPEEYMKYFTADGETINKNTILMTDFRTDDLFDHVEYQNRLVFPVNRLLCDVERFRRDEDEVMSKKGMGLCYTHGANGELLHPYNADLRIEVIDRYYDPHHAQLLAMANQAISKHGSCIIVDAHSFPSKPLSYEADQDEVRPDFCVGTDAIHTPKGLADIVCNCIKGMGYSVALNKPFAGTIIPFSMLGTDAKIVSIMIEVNRKLYMDELNQTISSGYEDTKAAVNTILESIAIAYRCN